MIAISNLLNLQFLIFVTMLIGIVARKKGIISEQGKKSLTNLCVNVILPCNIIGSFCMEMDYNILISSLQILLIAIAIQIVCIFLGKLCYAHVNDDQKSILKYATICSNAGFMGNAIIDGLYGAQGVLYTSIYLIPVRICMWSAGLSCFTKVKKGELVKKLLTHPCIVAVEIGLTILLLQITLPVPVASVVNSIGKCNTAISMILVGVILAEINPKTVCSKVNFYYCFIRLIAIPGVLLIICKAAKVDSLITGIAVILAGMPAGSTTAILASQYDGDAQFASKIVLCSTVLSIFSIPLWGLLI